MSYEKQRFENMERLKEDNSQFLKRKVFMVHKNEIIKQKRVEMEEEGYHVYLQKRRAEIII